MKPKMRRKNDREREQAEISYAAALSSLEGISSSCRAAKLAQLPVILPPHWRAGCGDLKREPSLADPSAQAPEGKVSVTPASRR